MWSPNRAATSFPHRVRRPFALTRIDNYLKALGMIDGEPDLPDRQLVMRGGRTLQRLLHGGLFYPAVGIEALSALVPGGTVLGRVVDAHTFEVLQTITAPYEQSAFQIRPSFDRSTPATTPTSSATPRKPSSCRSCIDWRFR